jgi:hypothetical protein
MAALRFVLDGMRGMLFMCRYRRQSKPDHRAPVIYKLMGIHVFLSINMDRLSLVHRKSQTGPNHLLGRLGRRLVLNNH